MLSVASVRSASGAAGYFAKDDYYTVDDSSEVSAWGGEGASDLGLSGEVAKDAFEGILNGILPSGEGVAQVENRRSGVDLTFSAPKSVSLLAYVTGDKRILGENGANMKAVARAMAWVEKNLAEGRKDVEGRKVPVQTGNLVFALFQHDTSRALDPQAHVHAVIANLTKMPDGKWQALHADKIWSNNTVIGSIYHAFLREEMEKRAAQFEYSLRLATGTLDPTPGSCAPVDGQTAAHVLQREYGGLRIEIERPGAAFGCELVTQRVDNVVGRTPDERDFVKSHEQGGCRGRHDEARPISCGKTSAVLARLKALIHEEARPIVAPERIRRPARRMRLMPQETNGIRAYARFVEDRVESQRHMFIVCFLPESADACGAGWWRLQ